MQSLKIAILAIAVVAIIAGLNACKKKDQQTPNLDATRRQLYTAFKNGEIDEGTYNGDTVYCAGINAYDAGATVVDGFGKQIGVCNYAWGQVDPICSQVQNNRVIYRCKNHITGLPFVDVYDLSK